MHLCGSFDNGGRECCKYCSHFYLWGVSAGYCSYKKDDVLTWDEACDGYEYDESEVDYV